MRNKRGGSNAMSLESGDLSKDDFGEKYEKAEEDNCFVDQIWMSHTERPLLPLKPLQKSKSCISLVQTIKDLAIKKTSGAKRCSSPEFQENTSDYKREVYSSGTNISKDYRTEDFGIKEQKLKRFSDTENFGGRKNFAWYHPIDAREATKRLLAMRQNGAFLIRPASNPSPEILHTLCVVYSATVYNFHVRNWRNGRVALGNKSEQRTFSSMLEMIKYHQKVPISIYLAESGQRAYVHLLVTPSK